MGASLPSHMSCAHCCAREIGLEKHAWNGKFRRPCAVSRACSPVDEYPLAFAAVLSLRDQGMEHNTNSVRNCKVGGLSRCGIDKTEL